MRTAAFALLLAAGLATAISLPFNAENPLPWEVRRGRGAGRGIGGGARDARGAGRACARVSSPPDPDPAQLAPPLQVCEIYNATECGDHTDKCSLCTGPDGRELCFDAIIAKQLPPCERGHRGRAGGRPGGGGGGRRGGRGVAL